MARKRRSAGHAIGGIIAGIEQQLFRTTPPASELVAKGTPLRSVAASGGGTISVGMPDDIGTEEAAPERALEEDAMDPPGLDPPHNRGAG